MIGTGPPRLRFFRGYASNQNCATWDYIARIPKAAKNALETDTKRGSMKSSSGKLSELERFRSLCFRPDEVVLLASTAGAFGGTLLVLTTQKLLALKKNVAPIYMPFPHWQVARVDPRKNRIAVTYGRSQWTFSSVDLVDDIVALSRLLPTDDVYGFVKQLNSPEGLRTDPLADPYLGMSGWLAASVERMRPARTDITESEYEYIFVEVYTEDGESYQPEVASALKEWNLSTDPYVPVEMSAGYIMDECVTWIVREGSTVYSGDIVALLGDKLILAPASGQVEQIWLFRPEDRGEVKDKDDEEYEKEEQDDGMFFEHKSDYAFTTWAQDCIIGRIKIDSTLVVPDRRSKPEPSPMRIRNPHDAEVVAAHWIRYWGWVDAQVSRVGADEGKDVESDDIVAQVKAHANPIGRPDIQNLYGVAQAEGKKPLFFSLSNYTAQAQEWANRVGVALFIFDLEGRPEPVNLAARMLIHEALG